MTTLTLTKPETGAKFYGEVARIQKSSGMPPSRLLQGTSDPLIEKEWHFLKNLQFDELVPAQYHEVLDIAIPAASRSRFSTRFEIEMLKGITCDESDAQALSPVVEIIAGPSTSERPDYERMMYDFLGLCRKLLNRCKGC